jgi:hypothetical protein
VADHLRGGGGARRVDMFMLCEYKDEWKKLQNDTGSLGLKE